jgi:excisionase family DNA binding protein
MEGAMQTKYLTREQAADYLGISLGHLAELLKEPNPMPVFRLGRRLVFRTTDIDQWIESFRVKQTRREALQ